MNLVDEKAVVALLQEATRISDEAGLAAFPARVREVYGLRHVTYVATGIGYGERLYVAGTYPQQWFEWYDQDTAKFDPVMRSALEGRLAVWNVVEATDDFGRLIMDKRRTLIGENGVTLPILSSDESTGIISYVDDGSRNDWGKRVALLVRELKQVGTAMHKAALTVMGITPQQIAMSDRHIQIIQLLAAGMNEPSIANVLDVSERTVKQHISEAKTRMRCRSKAHLVAQAISQGYLDKPV